MQPKDCTAMLINDKIEFKAKTLLKIELPFRWKCFNSSRKIIFLNLYMTNNIASNYIK